VLDRQGVAWAAVVSGRGQRGEPLLLVGVDLRLDRDGLVAEGSRGRVKSRQVGFGVTVLDGWSALAAFMTACQANTTLAATATNAMQNVSGLRSLVSSARSSRVSFSLGVGDGQEPLLEAEVFGSDGTGEDAGLPKGSVDFSSVSASHD
jgi:hypothetical protein